MKIARLKMPLGIVLAVVALLAISVAPVMAQPVTSPFRGDGTIDAAAAPNGSEVAAYVGDETEARGTATTTDGEYALALIGTATDVGKSVSFKVKKAGTEVWLDATTDPANPTFANYDPQVVDLFASTGPAPTIAFSPESFSFTATEGGANPAAQTLEIWNSGEEGSTLDWSVSDDAAWLSLSPTSGSSTGEHDAVTVSVDMSGMSASDYSAAIAISAEGATNTPQEVSVSLTISEAPVTVTWNCPLGHQVLISPYPKNGRASLSTAASLSEVTTDAEWFQVYWLDESTGEYNWFISGYAENTLLTLQPDEFYLVIVSAPCELTIPQ